MRCSYSSLWVFNDTYAQARGNILMMNPLPNINVAYSLILQDENQKETYMVLLAILTLYLSWLIAIQIKTKMVSSFRNPAQVHQDLELSKTWAILRLTTINRVGRLLDIQDRIQGLQEKRNITLMFFVIIVVKQVMSQMISIDSQDFLRIVTSQMTKPIQHQ